MSQIDAPIRASIVIPTYKRHDLLRRCLEAACRQQWQGDAYEVIIADDSASAATRQFVEGFAQELSSDPACVVRYVAVEHARGPAAARNAGWHAARGEVIAFTDDDCIPSPTWLSAGTGYLREHVGLAAAWGKLVMPLGNSPTDYERDAAGLASSVFVTANCFVRRHALSEVHGFDELFRVAWREDTDLYFTLIEHGFEIGHVGNALVTHPIRPARWGVSIQQQRKSRFDMLLYLKHPELYRRFVAPFPAFYVLICGTGLLGLLAGMIDQWRLCVVSVAISLAICFWFAVRRLRGTRRSISHIVEMLVTSLIIPWLAVYNRVIGYFEASQMLKVDQHFLWNKDQGIDSRCLELTSSFNFLSARQTDKN